MMDEEGMRKRLATLQTENECSRKTNRQLAQRMLDLEAPIVDLRDRFSQMPQGSGLPVDMLGAAIVNALVQANTALAREKGEINCTIAELSCDIKGFLGTAGSSLTVLPANVLNAQAANSMSVVRFDVSNIPAGKSGHRRQ